MGKVYDGITPRVRAFIEAQHVFFVGSAPAGDAGHVNVSPKGERTQLEAWAARKGPDGLRAYQRDKNARSVDGLPALRWVTED
jgi:hypothetical protein